MPKSCPSYRAPFREQLVELVRAGRPPEELSREFKPTAQTIHNCVAQYERDRGTRKDGPTTVEQIELRQLRREVRQLKLEREILSKPGAWFARETGTIPKTSGETSDS